MIRSEHKSIKQLTDTQKTAAAAAAYIRRYNKRRQNIKTASVKSTPIIILRSAVLE